MPKTSPGNESISGTGAAGLGVGTAGLDAGAAELGAGCFGLGTGAAGLGAGLVRSGDRYAGMLAWRPSERVKPPG